MGDTVNTDWNNAGPTMPNNLQAISQGTQVGQQLGAASALQGLNMNDPASVDSAISGLASHGALEQGSALAGLSEARQKLSLWPAGIELGRRNLQAALAEQSSDNSNAPPGLAPTPPPQAPAPTASNFQFDPVNTRNIMMLAQNATQQLLNAPPEQRPALAAQVKAQMLKEGVPEPAIDSALGTQKQPDGSETYTLDQPHLQGLHDHYQAVVQHLGQSIAAKQQPQAAGSAPGAPPPAPGAPTAPPGPVTGAGAPGVPPPTTTVSTPGGVAPPPAESAADVATVAPRLPTHVNPYPAAPAPAEAAAAPAPTNPLLTHDSNNWSAPYLTHPAVIAANKWMQSVGIPGVADLEPTALAMQTPNIARQSQLDFTQPQANATDAVTLGTTTVNGRQLQAPELLIRAAEGGVPGLDPVKAQDFLHQRASSPTNVGAGYTPDEQAYLTNYGGTAGAAKNTLGHDVINGQGVTAPLSTLLDAHRAGTPGLGMELTPAAAATVPADAKALQEYTADLPRQNAQIQMSGINGQKITALAQGIKTGKYTPQLADLMSTFTLPGKQSDYANNVGMLTSDLSSSFHDALNGLAVPRIASEAGAITGAIPHVAAQQDQIALYGAGLTAASNYAKAQNKFMNDYFTSHPSNPSMAAAQAAWTAPGSPGARSIMMDPAFAHLKMANGLPAVMPYKGKPGYAVFAPGTAANFVFKVEP